MDCPVCKKSPMITLELDEVEVDYCLECEGIWLDSGELEALFDDDGQAKKLLDSFLVAAGHSEKVHKCPICLKKMQKVSVGEDLLIDSCKKNGHGLWFDSGELADVLEKGELDSEHKIQKLLKDIFANS